MKLTFIRQIWNAFTGQLEANDTESVNDAFCNSVLDKVKIGDEVLDIWAEPVLLQCLDIYYLIRKLVTRGGNARRMLAESLKDNGVQKHIGNPPSDVVAIEVKVKEGSIWYALSKEVNNSLPLIITGIKGVDFDAELTPEHGHNKPYMLGRGNESEDLSTMVSIPDENNVISRKQVLIFCEQGKWQCKAVSSSACKTYVPHKTGDLVMPSETVLLVDKRRPENIIKFQNGSDVIVLKCALKKAE